MHLFSFLNLMIIGVWLNNILNQSLKIEYTYVCISTNNPNDVVFNWLENKWKLKKILLLMWVVNLRIPVVFNRSSEMSTIIL